MKHVKSHGLLSVNSLSDKTYVDMAIQKVVLALVDVVVSMLPSVVEREGVAVESSLAPEEKALVAFELLQVVVVVVDR